MDIVLKTMENNGKRKEADYQGFLISPWCF